MKITGIDHDVKKALCVTDRGVVVYMQRPGGAIDVYGVGDADLPPVGKDLREWLDNITPADLDYKLSILDDAAECDQVMAHIETRESDRYISLGEWCKRHHRDRGNTLRMIYAGRLPARKIGRHWVIDATTRPPKDRRYKENR